MISNYEFHGDEREIELERYEAREAYWAEHADEMYDDFNFEEDRKP